MTFDECKAIVEKFTYKPNWRFVVEKGDGKPHMLVAHVTELDSVDPAKTLNCKRGIFIYEGADATYEDLRAIVRSLIFWHERHEQEEWLRYDGKRLSEPHPPVVEY